jgi:hypothetical protein
MSAIPNGRELTHNTTFNTNSSKKVNFCVQSLAFLTLFSELNYVFRFQYLPSYYGGQATSVRVAGQILVGERESVFHLICFSVRKSADQSSRADFTRLIVITTISIFILCLFFCFFSVLNIASFFASPIFIVMAAALASSENDNLIQLTEEDDSRQPPVYPSRNALTADNPTAPGQTF